jgi:transcriptional regulator with XRE-family HTH domain
VLACRRPSPPTPAYAGDKSADDAKGDGVGGQWYAVKASGSSGGGPAHLRVICYKLYRMEAIHPGDLIRAKRRGSRITQRQLASRMGTTQSAIAALERASSNPTVRTLADALDALGYQLSFCATPKPAGVDESLIRQQLELSPGERLRQLERMAAESRKMMLAGSRARGELD